MNKIEKEIYKHSISIKPLNINLFNGDNRSTNTDKTYELQLNVIIILSVNNSYKNRDR